MTETIAIRISDTGALVYGPGLNRPRLVSRSKAHEWLRELAVLDPLWIDDGLLSVFEIPDDAAAEFIARVKAATPAVPQRPMRNDYRFYPTQSEID